MIALEFHVDYWNQLGWSDPFSSAAFSARQRKRAQYMGNAGVYTPQMVVDGQDEFTGSRETAARSAIEHAAWTAHVPVRLARERDAITIDVGAIPTNETLPNRDVPPSAGPSTRVMMAITEPGLRTNVLAGENRGSTLEHGPVVRSLRDVGSERRVTQPRVAGRRVVVFVETARFDARPRRRDDRLTRVKVTLYSLLALVVVTPRAHRRSASKAFRSRRCRSIFSAASK